MAVRDYAPIYEAAGREWNVDPRLLMAQAEQESGGKPDLKGALDELGIAQFRPATAAAVGLVDRTNPEHSIWAQAKLMSQLLDRFKTPELALAAYNAGEGRVADHVTKGAPLPASTVNQYIPSIQGHYKRYAADNTPGVRPVSDAKPSPAAPDVEDDAAFLKRTTEDDGAFLNRAAPTEESDDAFLKRTGAVAHPAAPPAPPVKPPVLVPNPDGGAPMALPEPGSAQPPGDAMGAGPPPAATGGIPPAIAHIGNALISPWRDGGPLGPDTSTGQFYNGPMGLVNKLAVAGPLSVLDAAGRTVQSVARGAGALGNELTQGLGGDHGMGARLERDVAQLPDALAGMMVLPSKNIPRAVRAQLAQDAVAEMSPGASMVADRMAGGSASGPATSAMVREQAQNALVAQTRRQEEQNLASNPLVAGDRAGGGLPNSGPAPLGDPRSVGAAGTPNELTTMPRAEAIAQRATGEVQRLIEPQPQGVDANNYVPGVSPTEAHMVQNARASRNEKLLESEMPDGFKQRRAENNDARVNFFQDMAGTDTLIRRAIEDRAARAETDLRAAWANKTAADTAPVMETAQAILESPDGRRPAVRAAVDSVTKELLDAKGNPITDPELLYGVRKHIDDLLSKAGAADNPMATRVKAQLLDLKKALDGAIEPAAPGFRQYLDNFATASRPIDEMEVLQGYLKGKSLLDSRNQMTYSGVQRMMRDIVTDRASNDINPAHSITDDTMAKLWALRDDLRRVASAEDLAKARGSDTFQNFADFVKSGAKTGALGAAHAVAGPLTGGIGNIAINALVNSSRAKGLRKATDRALNPDRENALAPPRRDH